MADKKTPNVVLFPGAAPSMQHLIDDALEQCKNPPEAGIIVFIDKLDDGQINMTHYCNRQEMAVVGARLIYLAGRAAGLEE